MVLIAQLATSFSAQTCCMMSSLMSQEKLLQRMALQKLTTNSSMIIFSFQLRIV
jgi:hypothetical protein